MPDIVIGPYNTVALVAGEVTRLKGDLDANRTLDLLNLGPGAIWIRAEGDPAIDDPQSQLLPANWGQNGMVVKGSIGLGVVADADTRISVRVA